jgi:hypothetical protein
MNRVAHHQHPGHSQSDLIRESPNEIRYLAELDKESGLPVIRVAHAQ